MEKNCGIGGTERKPGGLGHVKVEECLGARGRGPVRQDLAGRGREVGSESTVVRETNWRLLGQVVT